MVRVPGRGRAPRPRRARARPGRRPALARHRRLRVPATTAPPRRPVSRRPPGPHLTGRPTAPRSGRPHPTVPPRAAPGRPLTRRPGSCLRSRRRRPPGRPNRGLRTVPVPRGCPVRPALQPVRPTSAVRAAARRGPRRRVPARRAVLPDRAPVVPRGVRTRAPGRPGPGPPDLVLPVRGHPGPPHRVRARGHRVPARGRVTTRSARPPPAWVRRLRPAPRARAHLARRAVPVLRAVPAGPVLAGQARVAPRGPGRPRAARVPAGSRVRDPAVPGRAR